MLVGRVVGHEIENDLEAGIMRDRDQRIEIRHAAEQRVDPCVIGDVVAEVGHRRGKDRR